MPLQFMQPKFKVASLATSCSHYLNNVFGLFVCLSFMKSMYVYDRKQIPLIRGEKTMFHQPHKTIINRFSMHIFGSK